MRQLADFAEVLPLLNPQTSVVMHSGCAEPRRLAAELARHAKLLRGLRLYTMMPMGNAPYASTPPESVELVTFFPGKALRAAVSGGRAKIIRTALSGIPKLFREGAIKPDVLMLQLSPPDEHGRMSLGVSVDYMRAVLDQRPIVIAEINPEMPYTRGDTLVSEDQIDYAWNSDAPLQDVSPIEPDLIDQRIAEHVAGLIPNGAVIQVGIGTLPDAVLGQLCTLRDLGVHTGIMTDALLPLLNKGIVTNETKKQFQGRCVTTMAAGTHRFYKALDRNSSIEFHPCSVTHESDVIASIERFRAINAALEIDLAGRANAERINGRTISGPGGLPDFARGASMAKNGASIIALRSVSKDGSRSNIVGALTPDVPITVTAAEIDYVATEHGVACVRGLRGGRLAQALIEIAHPDFRAQLRQFASTVKKPV